VRIFSHEKTMMTQVTDQPHRTTKKKEKKKNPEYFSVLWDTLLMTDMIRAAALDDTVHVCHSAEVNP
jgi:hypothetical protein